MIVYPVGSSGQRLVLTADVIAHLECHRQSRWWHREAGGQLFARFTLPDIVIERATGPRRRDWRSRCAYRPHRASEQREIAEQHRRGLHFVGDWHTHPESVPAPSERDMISMSEMVTQSRHALNGFVLVIVGTEPAPRGLFVSIFDARHCAILQPALMSADARRAAEPQAT